MSRQSGLSDAVEPARSSGWRRLPAVALVTLGHAVVLLALLSAQPQPPTAVEPEVIPVALVELPPPAPPPPPPPPPPKVEEPSAPPAAARPLPPPKVRPAPAPPEVAPLRTATAPKAEKFVALSEAELVGATTAGTGSGDGDGDSSGAGHSCDMVRRLQRALRRDPAIHSAVAGSGSAGRAILVWNGDWVRSPSQDGKGLAAVRQAISVEVAFAPEACRAQPMHGLVLISLNDAPGASRLVLGSGAWRWSDLLHAHTGAPVSAYPTR